jgi:tetratricopeptide (TPR) repeat protein
MLYLGIPAGLAVLIVHTLFPVHVPKEGPMARALVYQRAGLFDEAEQQLRPLLEQERDNTSFHRKYLEIHFKRAPLGKEQTKRDDDRVLAFYLGLFKSADEEQRDTATYLLGLFWSHTGDYYRARNLYRRVRNKKLEYLNISIGRLYANQGKHQEAVAFFHRAVADETNLDLAVRNLAVSSYALKDWHAIQTLLDDEKLSNRTVVNATVVFRKDLGR